MTTTTYRARLSSVASLRAWKLALIGPSVYWYFPILYVLLTSKNAVSPIGIAALLAVLMISASWGFLLNDLFDRDADAQSGRSDAIHGHGLSKSTMQWLILSSAIASWFVVFLIGGGIIFKLVLAINYMIAIFYSVPPIKLKIRRFWGFLANSLMERPLPILVFLTYMNYYSIETLVLPIVMELTWSVFKHQTADVRGDIEAGVTTFAAQLGEKVSTRIVKFFLNPLSVFSMLFLVVLAWSNIPELRVIMMFCFVFIILGVILALMAERLGKITTYVTPTDPPYIMFLNLSYKFFLLPIMALGILISFPQYYLLLLFLLATLGYQAYGYSKITKQFQH